MAESITVRAFIKGIDQTPRKVSIVASLVRGRSVADALVILDHTPRRAALAVKKAIASAAANATLVISTLNVTAGPRMRRYKPASRGRALPFEKKSSHILVEVTGTEKPKKKPAIKKDEPKVAKKPATKTAVKKNDKKVEEK